MTWVKLDDQFYDNPTNRELGATARDLFFAGLCYCAKGLTNGRIPKCDVPLVLAQAQTKPATVKRLLEFGRWVDGGTFYEIPEYLTYNPSREKVLADREASRQRMRSYRSSPVRSPERSDVGTPTPSRPVPSPTTSSSNGCNSTDPNSVKNEEVEAVLGCFADLKRDRAGATIDNPQRWRATVISNARAEHGERIERWLAMFDLPPQRLAAGLIDGPHPTWTQHRKEDS